MTKLEQRLKTLPNDIAEAIRFYEAHISKEFLEECRQAEGTEIYVDLLIQKYKEMFKK